VLGEPVSRAPSFAIFGDSIANGAGDSYSNGSFNGYISRGLNAVSPAYSVPFSKFTMPGSVAVNAIKFGPNKFSMLMEHDFIIWEYIVNDIGTGVYASLSALQTAFLGYWQWLSSSGAVVIPCTCTPVTTTTDTYATAGNQTPSLGGLGEAGRTAYNTWLRNGSARAAANALGFDIPYIIDPCAYVEVNSSNVLTLNGGRWLTNGTANYPSTDGTHPTAAMAAIAAQAVTNVVSGLTI
jgi:hypothetical protein